jgi:Domain of unknown function (DUF4919)
MSRITTQVRAACGTIPSKANAEADSSSEPRGVAIASTGMIDLYRQFLLEPSADNYRAALSALSNAESDAIPSLLAVEQAFCEGRYETVRTLGRQWTRHFALSPRFHHLAALAARELGDVEDAELERFTASACLEGILASGDGSQARPFIISETADAHEILAKQGHKTLHQTFVEVGKTLCDVFEVEAKGKESREIWFTFANRTAGSAKKPNSKSQTSRRPKVTV